MNGDVGIRKKMQLNHPCDVKSGRAIANSSEELLDIRWDFMEQASESLLLTTPKQRRRFNLQ